MRLFTAIELSDTARSAIAAQQERIREELGPASRALRFVRAGHLHLTLVFIGEVADDRAGEIAGAMQRDIPIGPFELVFGGIGTFPAGGAPRVLWLGTLRGQDAVVELYERVSSVLAACAVAIDPRPFRPHLTLARWRERERGKRPALQGGDRIVARMNVDRVTLFQSRLSSSGPTYTALAHAPLTCS